MSINVVDMLHLDNLTESAKVILGGQAGMPVLRVMNLALRFHSVGQTFLSDRRVYCDNL